MKDLKIFIVILNWNRHEDTIKCLESLEKLIVEEYEIRVVVVDNGSEEKDIEKLRGFKTNNYNLKIIENKDRCPGADH